LVAGASPVIFAGITEYDLHTQRLLDADHKVIEP
jgi:hypothetical protein